jgi:arylformamidase
VVNEADEKRVIFDFEINFSNGGGMQGQGLDIEGGYIDDQTLANYIVEDMRLLMVGDTRILNKQVISEKHKRS